MKRDDFDKAKKIAEQWPAWKRDYQLTKAQVLNSAEDQKFKKDAKEKSS
ncbi:hypothetical protein [Pseudomonas sp. NBRC 100443]|nr:hypothetical protein [Pseudomonas sp. NBRC 100443]GLU39776.1 hypothetical protein Pssp01_38690 [Pseudomonas sp. NBRC 100443]